MFENKTLSNFGQSGKEDKFYPSPHNLMSVNSKIRQASFVASIRKFRDTKIFSRGLNGGEHYGHIDVKEKFENLS
jgi:hypothetical protein